MAEIKQPVLLIHGERSELSSKKYCDALHASLSGVSLEGGAVIYTVKGAGTFLSIIPTSASSVNRVVRDFIHRILPKSRSDLKPPDNPIPERMEQALQRLAGLKLSSNNGKSFSHLDPMSSLSFSCCSPSVEKTQEALLKQYCEGRLYAFNPLGPDGKPTRKLSEGKDEGWFQVGTDGMSISTPSKYLPPEPKKEPEKESKHRNLQGIVETKVIKTSIASANMVDKYIIKGPMAKVVREVPSFTPKPIGRMILPQ